MKKIVFYLLALMLVLGTVALASCRKDVDDEIAKSSQSTAEQTVESTEDPTQVTEPATEAPTTADPAAGSWSPKV